MLRIIEHSAVADALTVMRDRHTSIAEFRTRTRTIARALAYEATRELPVESSWIETPVGPTEGRRLSAPVVATPILRAGLGMLDAFLEIVPESATGFIGLKRNEETLLPYEYYRNLPPLEATHLFVLDPMLATGGSVGAALRSIDLDAPASISLLSIIAAPEGIEALHGEFPRVKIFTAAVDEKLNAHGFIVPGLGDAGDRLCGTL